MVEEPPPAPKPRKRRRWLRRALIGGGVAVALFVVLSIIAAFMLGLGWPTEAPTASLVVIPLPDGFAVAHRGGDPLPFERLEILVSKGTERVSIRISDGNHYKVGDMLTVRLTAPPRVAVDGRVLPVEAQGSVGVGSGDAIEIRMTYRGVKPPEGPGTVPILSPRVQLP